MADDAGNTNNTAAKMDIIADEGDLILAVGNEKKKKKMRVSSVILSMASPVSKALLGPHFREGQRLRNGTSPIEILLPDDSSESLQKYSTSCTFEVEGWKHLAKEHLLHGSCSPLP